jgi:vacuolar-type H+-ATPase subunit F/Vma7
MRVRAVSRPALASGLELAGLEVARASDGAEAADALRRFASDRDVGIVLVDAELHRSLPRDLMTRLDRQPLPVIIAVPAPRWEERSEAETQILEILRQAIGYRVRAR